MHRAHGLPKGVDQRHRDGLGLIDRQQDRSGLARRDGVRARLEEVGFPRFNDNTPRGTDVGGAIHVQVFREVLFS